MLIETIGEWIMQNLFRASIPSAKTNSNTRKEHLVIGPKKEWS